MLSHTPSTIPADESVSDAAQRMGVLLLDQTPQVEGIYTILRDETSSKEDFIFYCDRISTILVERAMAELPFRPVEVTTPAGERYSGRKLGAKVDMCILLSIHMVNHSPGPLWRHYCSLVGEPFKTRLRFPHPFVRGGPLERGLQRVANDIPIGSLLIQPEPSTSEPLLMHHQLPSCIRERHRAQCAWVIVLGSQVWLSFFSKTLCTLHVMWIFLFAPQDD